LFTLNDIPMSFQNKNILALHDTDDSFISASDNSQLSLVSENYGSNIEDPMSIVNTYLSLVEDSVNMMMMTAVMEAKMKKDLAKKRANLES